MAVKFEKVVMAGVGLICGSLALDMRQRKLAGEIIGYGRGEKNLRTARRKGIIDDYFLAPESFPEGVDLLVMGTPVEAIAPLTRAFSPKLRAGAIVTDVGSVKAGIVRAMEKIVPEDVCFVAGHPIAGSEQWGAEAARRGLFMRRRCILTPTRRTNRAALGKVGALWRSVGAKVEEMSPETHDQVLGTISHLPHVLVYALVNVLERRPPKGVDLKKYCAGGFKDFTRIASSRPELWRDICLMNRAALGKSLGGYIKDLQRLHGWIRSGKGALLEREFARACETRARIP